MSNFRKIQIFFNDKGEQVDSAGRAIKNSDIIRLIYDETVVLCAKFIRVTNVDDIPENEPVALDPNAAFSCFGDTGFQSENLIFIAQNNPDNPQKCAVNLPGDWIDGNDAKPENGELSFRISTDNINFADALAGKQSRTCQMVITATPPGYTDCSVLALSAFIAYNRPSLQEFPTENTGREFLDANQIAALFAAAPQIEFTQTPEAAQTSSQRRPDDNFIRFRNNSIPNAKWSEWIEMFNGKSAYDIWLEQGNSGSAQQFLEAIKGEPAQPVEDIMINTGELDNYIFNAGKEILPVKGEAPLQLFDQNGVLANSYEGVKIQWNNDSLTIDLSSMNPPPQGIWKVKFAGGATKPDICVPVPIAPVKFDELYGAYAVMDRENPNVFTNAFTENIIRIKINLAAAEDYSGNITIKIRNRNSTLTTADIPITPQPASHIVALPQATSGNLVIQRVFDIGNEADSIPVTVYGINLEAKQ